MNKELKRVSFAVLAMFLALFLSTTTISVFQRETLQSDGRNVRVLYDSYSTQRGSILVNGEPIAQSVPVEDRYNYQREYANGPLYAPITGYFTLNQGTTGVESELNDFLSGTANEQFLEQLNAILTGQEAQGASVELTIDPAVQQAAWDALGDQTGAVVAIEPSTGRILAMVSKPTYDPNQLASHDTQAVIDTYEALEADEGDPLQNRAIGGALNPPGSVFKLVVTAAALENGLTPESEFPNPPTFTLPGSTATVSNSGEGSCGGTENATIATALRLSCNVAFAQIGLAVGEDRIRGLAEEFGFGQSVDVPMSSTPSVYPDEMDDAQLALSSFGQYDVRATPLQIAMVSSAIANGGELMRPTLLESIIGPDLETVEEYQPEGFSTPISQQTASTMTGMMVEGVGNGVASNARIGGVDVAGKTGTAENGNDEPYTLWFTGFAPANDPQVAVAVVVENGGGLGQSGSGNRVAAPIARQVMEAVLNQ
ncbi:peptidoglycan D,D-transpeptidase FtsI family protein [Herbiconiux sp. SYSU D00978]|uniref:peptidoglycan D,D-transpeptidase FtsI family protein n=1 Tax=Herbiconiux sp. SYSU D00978 TaxID=2812562 RepID=UPI001A97BA8A|nr:penicillin-binding protein 2 [Herbiconiux sp. SYSU D00978]